jgi:hypothetical protein
MSNLQDLLAPTDYERMGVPRLTLSQWLAERRERERAEREAREAAKADAEHAKQQTEWRRQRNLEIFRQAGIAPPQELLKS